jgi:hypothetical protein
MRGNDADVEKGSVVSDAAPLEAAPLPVAPMPDELAMEADPRLLVVTVVVVPVTVEAAVAVVSGAIVAEVIGTLVAVAPVA